VATPVPDDGIRLPRTAAARSRRVNDAGELDDAPGRARELLASLAEDSMAPLRIVLYVVLLSGLALRERLTGLAALVRRR
jgi:hypothetical protein